MRNAFAHPASKSIKIVPCDESQSFYSFIESELEKCSLTDGPLHRICSLMRKMKVTHYVREELVLNAELQTEVDDLVASLSEHRKKGGPTNAKAVRLTFLRTPTQPSLASLKDSDVLAYVVLLDFSYLDVSVTTEPPKLVRLKYVYESVVRLPSVKNAASGVMNPLTNHYFHTAKIFTTIIGSAIKHRRYRIPGTYFCQQNSISHVCAHSVLRMAINSSPHVSARRHVTAHDINKTLGIKMEKETIERGLTPEQIEKFAAKRRFGVVKIDLSTTPQVSYSPYAYQLVESRVPIVLCIDGWEGSRKYSHAVSVVGHTMNTDRWTPAARVDYDDFGVPRYISAAAWTDHFLISDDNLGMHCSLPAESLTSILLPEEDPHLRVSMVFGFVPKGVYSFATVEAQATFFLNEFLESLDKNARELRKQGVVLSPWLKYIKKKLVTRAMLLERTEYTAHLASLLPASVIHPEKIARMITRRFPKHVWMVEVTEPNLYSANKRKLGDIVFDTRKTGDGSTQPLFAWIPNLALLKDLLIETWPITGHVSLYRERNPLQPPSDW